MSESCKYKHGRFRNPKRSRDSSRVSESIKMCISESTKSEMLDCFVRLEPKVTRIAASV